MASRARPQDQERLKPVRSQKHRFPVDEFPHMGTARCSNEEQSRSSKCRSSCWIAILSCGQGRCQEEANSMSTQYHRNVTVSKTAQSHQLLMQTRLSGWETGLMHSSHWEAPLHGCRACSALHLMQHKALSATVSSPTLLTLNASSSF